MCSTVLVLFFVFYIEGLGQMEQPDEQQLVGNGQDSLVPAQIAGWTHSLPGEAPFQSKTVEKRQATSNMTYR